MIDYIVSDLHLNHKNIIGYCNRPFDSVKEMNKSIIDNWNSTVEETDTVLYLGDLTLGGEESCVKYLEKLNGNITFIKGNHDSITNYGSHKYIIHDTVNISYKGIKFYISHHTDEMVDGKYVIQGHKHNNDMGNYPFYNPSKRRFNVSIELIGYKPVPFINLVNIIKDNKNKKINQYTEHIK